MEEIKPPIGCKPRWLIVENRLRELSGAIERYKQADLVPNAEWYQEFFELHQWIVKYNGLKKG